MDTYRRWAVALSPELTHMIAQTRLVTDARRYVVLKIDPAHKLNRILTSEHLTVPFFAYLRDGDEVTLLLSQQAWQQIAPGIKAVALAFPYRLITLAVLLDFGLVGYLAALSSALAEDGVSILAFSAYSRDHILVAEADFDRAWETLQACIRACQEREPLLDEAMELM